MVDIRVKNNLCMIFIIEKNSFILRLINDNSLLSTVRGGSKMERYIVLITMHADPAMAPGYDEWGGTHTYMKELLDEFGKRKIRCLMFTRRSMQYLPYEEQYNEYCTVYRLTNGDNEPMSKTLLKKYHSQNVEQILEIIKKQGRLPEKLHSVYWNSGRIAADLSEKLEIPFVHSIISNSRGRVKRGAYEPMPEREFYEQEIYDKAQWLICVSDDEAADLMTLYNVDKDKIVVAGQYIHESFVMPSHDPNDFPRLNSTISRGSQIAAAEKYNKIAQPKSYDTFWAQKAFTYIGRMDRNKGLKHIFPSWNMLYNKYKNLCPPLWLAGGSLPEIEMIRSDFKEINPDLTILEQYGKIVWWGCIDPYGLSTVLLRTSVLLTHSLYEPGGRVAVEAMCEGVPVIGTPNGFAKDTITDWYNGFLVKFGDVAELSARMEHFIRQPYLSNTLGQNAIAAAKELMGSWRFIEKHLKCYFDCESSPKDENNAKPVLSHKKINLYPYCISRYSDETIKQFFHKCSGCTAEQLHILTNQNNSSDVYMVKCNNNQYVIKRTYTRLAISPMYNPVRKNEYARNAGKMFKTELQAYKRINSPLLVGYDEFHALLLLKKAEPFYVSSVDRLKLCIKNVLNNCQISKDEREKYIDIILLNDTPDKTIEKLNNEIEDFFFDPSCRFSGKLCWQTAAEMLNYNRSSIPSCIFMVLIDCVKHFSSTDEENTLERLCAVNTDLTFDHVYFFDGQICMIDHEKTAVGEPEAGVARLIHDFIIQQKLEKSMLPELFLAMNEIDGLRVRNLISFVAFGFFHDIIEKNVIYCTNDTENLKILQELMRL